MSDNVTFPLPSDIGDGDRVRAIYEEPVGRHLMFCWMVRLNMYGTAGCGWFKENIDFIGGMMYEEYVKELNLSFPFVRCGESMVVRNGVHPSRHCGRINYSFVVQDKNVVHVSRLGKNGFSL